MNGKNGFKMKNYFFYSQKFILISCKSPQKLVNKPKKQSVQSQKKTPFPVSFARLQVAYKPEQKVQG